MVSIVHYIKDNDYYELTSNIFPEDWKLEGARKQITRAYTNLRSTPFGEWNKVVKTSEYWPEIATYIQKGEEVPDRFKGHLKYIDSDGEWSYHKHPEAGAQLWEWGYGENSIKGKNPYTPEARLGIGFCDHPYTKQVFNKQSANRLIDHHRLREGYSDDKDEWVARQANFYVCELWPDLDTARGRFYDRLLENEAIPVLACKFHSVEDREFITVILQSGTDEFWENLKRDNQTYNRLGSVGDKAGQRELGN